METPRDPNDPAEPPPGGGFGPGSPGYGPGGGPPESPGGQPQPGQPPATGPQAPVQPQPTPAHRYGGPVPPGGWQQPVPAYGAVPQGQFASWWSRVGAAIIDGFIVFVPTLIVMSILGVGIVAADGGADVAAVIGGALVTVMILVVVAFVYAPLLMSRGGEHNGQTWGKQAAGIRVVRTTGHPFTFGYGALREVAVKNLAVGIASSFTFGIAPLLNYLWPLWDDENRALHDYVVQTRVVRA